MNIIDEIQLIGGGHKRFPDQIHGGYWTPQLASWTEVDGFTEIRDLQFFSWVEGEKITGNAVNASPIVCIPLTNISNSDLIVQITGLLGMPDPDYIVTSGDIVLTGFSSDIQYGFNIYRREWSTGGGEYRYEFIIPKFTKASSVFDLSTKRLYKITDVNINPRNSTQGFMEIGFYALADNGSKLLYTLNWNNIFENVTKSLFGQYPQPRKCYRCEGSGYVVNESDTCDQCNGYGFSGPNASGFLIDQLGREYGSMRGDDDIELYRNKLWALHTWHVTPTKKDIQRYLAHFARTSVYSVNIIENDRINGPTGVERVVDLQLPYDLPNAIFDVADPIWSQMVESIEPAGIQIRFSFLSEGLTGHFDVDSWLDPIMGYYKDAIFYTGIGISGDNTDALVSGTYGFEIPFESIDLGRSSWYKEWGEDWWFYNYGPSGHISGGISGLSGLLKTGASSPVWAEGLMQGTEWIFWAWPANTLVDDTVWNTGGATEVNQVTLLTDTIYKDNFWSSGLDGIQY